MRLCPFSKYKNIFGEPGVGLHSYRFLGVAIVDYIMTIVLAMIITKITGLPLVLSTILMFILGFIFHVTFGVSTDTTKFLGISC